MFKGYFISGNDTNVGKTIVSSILVNKLEAQYFKPIQCGKNEFSETDSDVVKKFCPNAEIIPEAYFFKDPVSPNIASKISNELINNLEEKGVKNISDIIGNQK